MHSERVDWRWCALVGVGAAAYFLVGIWYAVGWESGWIDSGLVIYGSWRVAEGAVPYRDFDHVYGPAVFHLNGALFRLLGVDLAVINLSLVALKAGFAVILFALGTMMGAPRRTVLAVVAAFVAVWGSPLWLFSAPYAQHYALLCAMLGLGLSVWRPQGLAAAFAAGLCFGVGATFKLTPGLFGFFAMVLSEVSAPTPHAARSARLAGWTRGVRGTAAAVTALATLAYVVGSLPSSADGAAMITAALMGLPLLGCAGAILRQEWARTHQAADADLGIPRLIAAATGLLLPPLAYVGYYASQGALAAFARDLVALPQRLGWFIALQPPALASVMLVAALVLLVVTGMRVGIRVLAAVVLAAAVAWLRPAGMPWSVYLPNTAVNRLGYDLMTLAPWLLVVWTLPQLARATLPLSHRQCILFATAQLLLLLPAADLWHALMGLPALLPLLLIAGRGREGGPKGATMNGPIALWLLVVVVAVPYVVQLASARRAWSGTTAQFVRATGVSHPGAKFVDVAEVVRYLDTPPVRDRAVLVLTGEALIYFLAGRHSAWEHGEYVLQLIARGVDVPAAAPLLTSPQRLLADLKRARPLLVDFRTDPAALRVGHWSPAIGRFLRARYRPRAVFGRYQILDLRPVGELPSSAADLTTR